MEALEGLAGGEKKLCKTFVRASQLLQLLALKPKRALRVVISS